MWGVQLVLLQLVHHADRSSMSYLSRPNFWSATNLWDLSWPNFVCVTVAISGTKLLRGLVTAQFLFTCHGPVPYTGISDSVYFMITQNVHYETYTQALEYAEISLLNCGLYAVSSYIEGVILTVSLLKRECHPNSAPLKIFRCHPYTPYKGMIVRYFSHVPFFNVVLKGLWVGRPSILFTSMSTNAPDL